jgi:hypothetical protein
MSLEQQILKLELDLNLFPAFPELCLTLKNWSTTFSI